MLPQGKVSSAGAKRQKRSAPTELNPLSMASSSGQSEPSAQAGQQNRGSVGRLPQKTFCFTAQVNGEHSVLLIFSPQFFADADLLLPQQAVQRIGLRPKPPPDEAGSSLSSSEYVQYGPLECSVELQAANGDVSVTSRLEAASPASSPLSASPPSTSYLPPESIVARIRSRRKKDRGLVELVDLQEAGPSETRDCGYIGPRGLLAWGLGFDATGLCLFPLSQGGRNLVSGLT